MTETEMRPRRNIGTSQDRDVETETEVIVLSQAFQIYVTFLTSYSVCKAEDL